MTDADWLKAKDPDKMLRLIGGRLSDRRWHLLACGVARRAWDVLPAGPLRDAVEWAEGHPGGTAGAPDAAGLGPAAGAGVEAARAAQREIVLAADPDADPDSFQHADAGKANPSAPLFQAACRAAGAAVAHAGEAVTHAAGAVAGLLSLPPGPAQLARVRAQVAEAARVRAVAGLYASAALKLAALGHDAADADNGRNARLRYAVAAQQATEEEEALSQKREALGAQAEKADRRAVGRLVLDLVGNPFTPYRFDPAWRTEAVVGLARAVAADRGWDRLPVLADALLDADCDEEPVLRHLRGTEAHAPDGPAHARGCWVVDLILEAEPGFFAAPPVAAPKPPPPPAAGPRPKTPGWAQLLDALRAGDAGDPDDHDE